MLPNLHSVQAQCRNAPRGLTRVDIIDPADLVVQPRWWVANLIDEIQFKPGKAAFALPVDLHTGRFQDRTLTNSSAGDLFEVSLEANLRKVRLDVDYLRQKLRNRRVHVVGTYRDGLQRLALNMRVSLDGDSGGRGTGRNGYSVRGAARMLRLPAFVNAPFDVNEGGVITPPPPTEPPGNDPVTLTTSNSTYTWNMPAGRLLVAVYIQSTAESAGGVFVGRTVGGSELGGPSFGTQHIFSMNNFRTGSTGAPIYISGLAGASTLEIWTIG